MNNELHYQPGNRAAAIGHEHPLPREIFAAEIIFGSPKKKCAGAGICKVNSPASYQPGTMSCLNCNRAAALIRVEPPETVVFQFVRRSMSKAIIQKHFGNGVFFLEDPFQFKKSFWQQAAQWAIPAGVYLVEAGTDYFTVRFRALKPTSARQRIS